MTMNITDPYASYLKALVESLTGAKVEIVVIAMGDAETVATANGVLDARGPKPRVRSRTFLEASVNKRLAKR
jgi:hypothetical protein